MNFIFFLLLLSQPAMPTVFSRTFALLNNIKPPPHDHILDSRVIQAGIEIEDGHISIELEAPVTKPDISIWKAAELGNLQALQYYIENTKGIDLTTLLNTRDPDTDCTLLHLVLSNARTHRNSILPIIKLLLDHGADATTCNIYNVQAIHMVPLHCPHQPLLCLEALLNHKANPNASDGDGWTPLHYAARFCQPPDEAIELLVSRGADVNRRDSSRKTPLFCLLANGDYPHALDYLIHSAKADITLLGDIVNPTTRQTCSASIVLQAVKYNRMECLSMILRSKTAMAQLKQVITREELQVAHEFIKGHYQMQLILQGLEDSLEKYSDSLLHAPTVKDKRGVLRRPSVMTVIDLLRHGSMGQSDSNKILKKVNQFMRRTKSESTHSNRK